MSLFAKIRLALDPELEARCPDHPLYRGLRRPKVLCARCDKIYAASGTLRAQELADD